MKAQGTRKKVREQSKPRPYRVRLPGFAREKEIGLGDMVKRATSAVGVKPCGGCEQRAAVLNRWAVISGW